MNPPDSSELMHSPPHPSPVAWFLFQMAWGGVTQEGWEPARPDSEVTPSSGVTGAGLPASLSFSILICARLEITTLPPTAVTHNERGDVCKVPAPAAFLQADQLGSAGCSKEDDGALGSGGGRTGEGERTRERFGEGWMEWRG